MAAGLVGPGIAVQRLLGLPVDRALVLPAGAAATAGLYWLGLAAGAPWLFPAALALLHGLMLLRRRPWAWAGAPPLRPAVLPALAWLAFLALTQYPWNRQGPGGEFVLDPLVPYDTAFHVGLSRELVLGYPPQVPGLSGFPLGYHLGPDLLRAAALRWTGLDPFDTITRLDPTVWGLGLMLLLAAAAARLGGSARAAALAPWTLLATDLAFLLAWGRPTAHWWTDLLRGNLLVSLVLANPVVPALALALGALLALARYESGEGRGWLALASGLALALPFFKVFLGAHLLIGVAAAAVRRRRCWPALAAMAAPAAAATAALALGQGGRTVEVAPAPLDLVQATWRALGREPLAGPALAAAAALWLAASLGLRLAGLPAALRALTGRSAWAAALAGMALAGWPLGLLFRVGAPEALADQKLVNDAAYFVEQAGPLLWIFTAAALAERVGAGVRAWAALAGAALLALPTTVQFAVQKRRWPNQALPAPMVRAMASLAAASRPGDVVLQRPGGRYPPAPVVLIGRRVPYERFTPWLTQFAPRRALEQRHEQVHRFFRTRDRGEALAIARALQARYLCLYGAERVRFETAGLLEPLHVEAEARVYRIRWDAG